MDEQRRTELQLLTEDYRDYSPSTPTPISCKGRKNVWGTPEVWNDKEGKCKPVSRKLGKAIKTAQQHSAKAIGSSMGTRIGKHSHESASKDHEIASQHHAAVASAYHREGFYSAAQAHAKQSQRHGVLRDTHTQKHAKQVKDAKKAQKAPGTLSPKPSGAVRTSSATRDHRGRFVRKT